MKRWIFSSLLVILLIPTLFISWLLTTENGLHQLYKLSAGYIPEELQLISLSGKLIGPIRIEKILYRDDKQAIEISRLDLDWDPWALLAGTVDIKQLTIESVALSLAATKKGGDKSTPLQLPEIQLPLQLKLGNMTLAQLQIHQGESVQEISNITVDSEILFDQIAINRLELETREVTLNLQGNIYPAENYNHDLQLTWKTSLLAATETRGRGDVRGDLSATQITQQISGALELKLSLQISDYLDQLKWRTRIDVSSFDTAILAPSSPKISGSLLLNASGDLNIARVNGEIRAKTDMLGPVTGNFKVEKGLTPALINEISIETLNLVSEHGKLAASGLVDWSKGINWQIKANTTALDPALMLPQWPGNINARFTSSGNLRDQQLSVTADIKQLNGQLRGYPVSMSGGLGWHDEILEMSDIKFNSGNTKIVGNGQLGDTLDLQWSIESENLAELYPDGQGKLRASGKLGGTRDKPLISARFIGEALQVPGYRVERVDGDATIKLLHYPEILIDPDLLQINLSAEEITFNDKQIQRVNLLADAKGIDADIDYLGSAFKIQLKGKPEADGWRGMLTRADINTTDYGNWTLLDPVETAVSPSAVELETLCLQNQHRTRLCAKVSQLADHWNIDISARDFVLATIKPWLPPELVVDGLADANAELQFHSSPRLSGKVKISLQPGSVEYNLVSNPVKNLRYVVGELTVDAGPSGINTSAKMTLDNGDEIDGSFQFTGADPLNFNLQSQKIAGKANVKLQDLTLIDTLVEQINSLEGQADVQLEVSGILGKPQIQARARLDNIGFGIVGTPLKFTQLSARLESPLLEKVSYQVEATVAEGRLRLNGNTRLNPEAGWPSDIEVDGDQLVIKELIWPWLPPGLAVEGVMQSSAKLTFNTADKLRGVVQLEASSGSLTYSLIEDGPDNWEFKNARITLDLNAQGISADAGFIISDNVARATLSLPGATLPGLDLETQTIVASADLDFKDLSMLEALVSEIQKTQGRLLVKLGVDGTLANPGYRAKVDLIEASVNIPRVGLALKNISLNATTNDTNELVFKGKVESGNGKISINGNSLLDPAKSWPTTISITGDRFEVARMPEATVQVSPDLKINITGTKINLSGEIIVPYAKLQPRDITTAAKVSSDTVILGADQPVEQKWVITSRVNLILGESVNFFGYGFEGKLGGRIIIEEQPGQPTRGIGEITILEGRYRAYGQRLDITNGRLLFSGGPITNPGLDLRATRTGRDNVIAGLNVRGRLQQPKVDLFSIPSLGQTDTLSYLLTGGPISSASGDEGAMMANAALALGLSGGDNIARSIGDKFGFDVMRVETNNTGDQASLVVGRYLTPRLYVSYGAGIIESINTLNLRYQISERWTLESENGEHQGADLLFSFEP